MIALFSALGFWIGCFVISVFVIGVLSVMFWRRQKTYLALQDRCRDLEDELQTSHYQQKLEAQRAADKLAILQKAQDDLKQSFAAASAEALQRNNKSFLDLAKETLGQFHEKAKGELKGREQAIDHLIKPIQQSLGQVDEKLQHLEKERKSAYDVLRHQVSDLVSSQKELRSETANLVKALRAPHVRGRWGEMQLKRVVEMSGMSAHCDFIEQQTYENEDSKLRPDMVVNLPGGKQVIIDAKAPLAGYLDAIEATDDETKSMHLETHARHVKKHIMDLAKRGYWDHVKDGDAPEFTVLFLPGETFFSAALEKDPSLIELGVEHKVILATPATLIALLHAVAYGWKQEALSQNAREISDAGKELYKRMSDLGKHFAKLGSDLNSAVGSYNKTVGTMERRVLPAARKFKALETTSAQVEMKEAQEIDHVTRDLQASELIEDQSETPSSVA